MDIEKSNMGGIRELWAFSVSPEVSETFEKFKLVLENSPANNTPTNPFPKYASKEDLGYIK